MNSYLKKIDDSFQSYYIDFDRVLKNQDSFVFLTPNRLDIIFKICYIHFTNSRIQSFYSFFLFSFYWELTLDFSLAFE